MGQWVAAKLAETGCQVLGPEGGFYLFPNFAFLRDELKQEGITTSPALCERLLADTGNVKKKKRGLLDIC